MDERYNIEWLKKQLQENKVVNYTFFWGHTNKTNQDVGNFCFSQWYRANFIVDGITYLTAEHWMMAQKARLFGDLTAFKKIIHCEQPKEAKSIGRQVIGFNEQIWHEKRYNIVREGNFHKFQQHNKLSNYLVQTSDSILVEASSTDTIWGIGLPNESTLKLDPHKWRGLNLLGFALMEVRDLLR